jgi:hypothetical protein
MAAGQAGGTGRWGFIKIANLPLPGGSQNTPLDGAGTHRPCVLMMRFTRLLGPLTCTNSSQRPAPGRCRSGSLTHGARARCVGGSSLDTFCGAV